MSAQTMNRGTARTRRPRLALALGALLALSACNGSAGEKAGSGDGPTAGAGSSNERGTATNGAPAAE